MARPGLTLHRKFKRLAATLNGSVQMGFGAILARGVLEALWEPSYETGDDYLGDATDVEARVGWPGKSGVLCEALRDAGGEDEPGFIEEGGSRWWPDGRSGAFRVHDLYDHAPRYVKRRLQLEEQRRSDGKTLSAIRAEAGRKGAAKRWHPGDSREASGQQPDGNVLPVCDSEMATGKQPIATPAPAPAPAPARAPACEPSAAGGRAKVEFGPLGAETVHRVAEGLGSGLLPLPSQDEADELERRIAREGGADAAVSYFASMCRKRDTKPYAVGLLLDWLRDVQGPEAAA